jgi:hypothetical protein
MQPQLFDRIVDVATGQAGDKQKQMMAPETQPRRAFGPDWTGFRNRCSISWIDLQLSRLPEVS